MLRRIVTMGLLACIACLPAAATELHQAVRENNTTVIKELLTSKIPADVNARAGQGVAPLHLAAVMNNAPIARLLLEHGARIEATTDGGFTPLHWAASRNALACIQLLLESGANPNATAEKGVTPLHWAAGKNATDAVRMLVATGANLQAETEDGLTPLHWAVRHPDTAESARVLAEILVGRQMAAEAAKAREIPPAETGETTADTATNAIAGTTDDANPFAPPGGGDRLPPIYIAPNTGPQRVLVVDIGLGESLRFVWIEAARVWMGQFEVSNAQFRRFRPEHHSGTREVFSLNDPRQPAVRVNWLDAKAFCEWLNQNYRDRIPPRFRFRLPTTAEWIVNAESGDGRTYPWGNTWPPTYGNYGDLTAREKLAEWEGIEGYDDGIVATAPVEQTHVSPWGIHGLAGNVWEWCEDWYSEDKRYKVRMGGSWFFDKEPNLRIRTFGFDLPDLRDDTIGFRLVIAQDGD